MDIQLNLINPSNDMSNAQVVIFQNNVAGGFDECPIAWKVIQHLGQGENHPFEYPMSPTISADDSRGNCSPQLAAENGQRFGMARTSSGDTLSLPGAGTSLNEIQCRNDLQQGSISVGLYKSGRLLLQKTSVAPGQMVAFALRPALFIGVVQQVEEGEVMDSAIISDIHTGLSLLGVAEADIIMTGGGPDQASTPFRFTLENIVMA